MVDWIFSGEKFLGNLWGEKPYRKRVTMHVMIGTYQWVGSAHPPIKTWHTYLL